MSCINPLVIAVPSNSSSFYTCVTNTINDNLKLDAPPELITGLAVTGITVVSLSLVSSLFEIASKKVTYLANLRRISSNAFGKLTCGLYFIASRLTALAVPALTLAHAYSVNPHVIDSDDDAFYNIPYYRFTYNVLKNCLSYDALNGCFLKGGPTCFASNSSFCTPGSCVSIWLNLSNFNSSGPGPITKSLPAFAYTGIYLLTVSWKPLLNRFKKHMDTKDESDDISIIDSIPEEILPLNIKNSELQREGLSSKPLGERTIEVLSPLCDYTNKCTSLIALIVLPFLALGSIVILCQGLDYKPWRNPNLETLKIMAQCADNCSILNSFICTCNELSDSIFCD